MECTDYQKVSKSLCSTLCTVNLASFPGLPCFLFFGLRSVQYTEAEEREKRGRPGLIHHVSGRGGGHVDVAGGADIQICNE